jgi:hypothetical protein
MVEMASSMALTLTGPVLMPIETSPFHSHFKSLIHDRFSDQLTRPPVT